MISDTFNMPKEYKIKPTERQKEAFKNIVENHCTKKEALIKAGYSKATAINPKNIENTVGFKILLDEQLPDREITAVHKRILHKEDRDGQPHSDAKTGVELAYKIKDKFPVIRKEIELTAPIPILESLKVVEGEIIEPQEVDTELLEGKDTPEA